VAGLSAGIGDRTGSPTRPQARIATLELSAAEWRDSPEQLYVDEGSSGVVCISVGGPCSEGDSGGGVCGKGDITYQWRVGRKSRWGRRSVEPREKESISHFLMP
jgi:hypothetical protein